MNSSCRESRRFVAANGALSKEQLLWFDSVLSQSEMLQQIVIVCSHVPLHPNAADPIATVWNYDRVLEIIGKYGCVKLVLSGHDHEGKEMERVAKVENFSLFLTFPQVDTLYIIRFIILCYQELSVSFSFDILLSCSHISFQNKDLR